VQQLLVWRIFRNQNLPLLSSLSAFDLEFVEHNQVDVQVLLYRIVFRLYRGQYNFPVGNQLNYLLNLIVDDMLDLIIVCYYKKKKVFFLLLNENLQSRKFCLPKVRAVEAWWTFKQLEQNVCWQSSTFGSCKISKQIGHWRRSSKFDAVAIDYEIYSYLKQKYKYNYLYI
jgi:hypothetical protein